MNTIRLPNDVARCRGEDAQDRVCVLRDSCCRFLAIANDDAWALENAVYVLIDPVPQVPTDTCDSYEDAEGD